MNEQTPVSDALHEGKNTGINRRGFLRQMGLGGGVLAASLITDSFLSRLMAAEGSTPGKKQMNFIFILADDLGWADVGFNGRKEWATPNLDALAKEGMIFKNAYAAASLCSPTRASILTGKYPARLHLTDWISGFVYPKAKLLNPDWRKAISLDELTVAEALQEAGYRTGIIGKWHVGSDATKQGFQDLMDFTGGNAHPRFVNNRFMDDVKGDAALDWLTKNKDNPFFLYFAPHSVHIPIAANKEKIEKFKKKGLSKEQAVYAGMVEHIDDNVGRIRKRLEELGIADRTAIIFTSDNGGVLPETSNAPLRAGKGTLYEGGVRMPTLIYCPGITKPGSVCDVPITSTDYYPTMLEVAGVNLRPEQHKDGISLLTVLKGGKCDRTTLFWHYPHYAGHNFSRPCGAIRQGDWKLIEWFEDGRLELYDLSKDVSEQNDLSAKYPDKAKELHTALMDWRKKVDAQMPKPNPDADPSYKLPTRKSPLIEEQSRKWMLE